jgi:hypothetical protein
MPKFLNTPDDAWLRRRVNFLRKENILDNTKGTREVQPRQLETRREVADEDWLHRVKKAALR